MFDIVPVFPRTLRSAAVPFIRFSSDPSTPAIGNARIHGDASDESYIRRRMISSASGVMTSRRERPDPSINCWPSAGMPHAATRVRKPASAASFVGNAPHRFIVQAELVEDIGGSVLKGTVVR